MVDHSSDGLQRMAVVGILEILKDYDVEPFSKRTEIAIHIVKALTNVTSKSDSHGMLDVLRKLEAPLAKEEM